MSSSYRMELDRWLSQLEVKADRILDVGGAQLPVKGRTKTWDVGEYLIADIEQPHKGHKPDIVLDLNYQRSAEGNQFDLIFCLEVFEYIFNPVGAINTICSFLKPDGSAWITFPSFYPHHQPIEDDSLRYMMGGIIKLADAADLIIREVIPRRPESNMLERFFSTERMRAAKDFDHHVTGYIVRMQK